jgi:hypothetical protein
MEEVIGKIKDLVATLEKKIADNDSKSKQLSIELSLAKEASVKIENKSVELDLREASVKQIEDVIRIAEETKEKLVEVSRIKSANCKESEEIAIAKDALKADEKKLSDMIALYRAKNESLEQEKVQLAVERKEMRAKILEDLKKLK